MKFKIHWLSGAGEPTIVEGPTIAEAMMLAGFGGGIVNVINWYEEIKEEEEGILEFLHNLQGDNMRKLTMKQVRKNRMKAFVDVLNCWYVNQHLLDPKYACYLSLIVER